MKTKISIAALLGFLLGMFINQTVPQVQADEHATARSQLLRAEDRQAAALESIASTLKEIRREMR